MAKDAGPSFDEVVRDTRAKMDKAQHHLEEELRKIRSGRATPGLVENIRVEYYGSPTPLSQLASISIPEPRLIVIKPFDKGSLGEIEKAVLKSDIGLTPSNDGKLVRLSVPPLSEERRKQLVGQIKKMAEQGRVAIRNIRRDQNKHAESLQKDGHFTEDDGKKLLDAIQEETKSSEKKIDSMVEKKSKEIMEV
jgi:ribosome recycling factor